MFKCGADGVGYYRDVPRILPLDIMVPPNDYHLYTFNAAQWSEIAWHADVVCKRARRQREANGKRKKKSTRRQVAIAMLPDDPSDKIDLPLSSTLQDRWWPKMGLWSVVTANANCWATASDNVANVAEDDFLMLQETKVFK